jgi:hypothetical protein
MIESTRSDVHDRGDKMFASNYWHMRARSSTRSNVTSYTMGLGNASCSRDTEAVVEAIASFAGEAPSAIGRRLRCTFAPVLYLAGSDSDGILPSDRAGYSLRKSTYNLDIKPSFIIFVHAIGEQGSELKLKDFTHRTYFRSKK